MAFSIVSREKTVRSIPGCDRTNLPPGLIRQIATGHVSDESSQTGVCI